MSPRTGKKKFREWYTAYDGSQAPLVVNSKNLKTDLLQQENFADPAKCHPNVDVHFNSIQLKTDCPGKWHVLKFTYHPAWQLDTKDELFLISPGFMLISPSQNVINMKFGPTWLWRISTLVSILTVALWAASRLRPYLVRFKKVKGEIS